MFNAEIAVFSVHSAVYMETLLAHDMCYLFLESRNLLVKI